MAALDFPASPTVGQVVTLTNGFSYTWDGSVWALTASTGQAAGGDLTGTYPNPQIAPLAVTAAKTAQGGSLFGPGGTYSDTSNLAIPSAVTEIKELSVALDPGRPVLLLLRIMFNVLKASAAGTLGAGLTVQTYIGGTTGAANGTLQSSEAFSHALPTQNVSYTAGYSYFGLYTPSASPLLWKVFASNGDTTNYTVTKTGISMVIVPFA